MGGPALEPFARKSLQRRPEGRDVDPDAAAARSQLSAARVIPPIEVPADTTYVKRFKFQSPMLTKFWGRPIYLGAVVLLPRDYDRQTMTYPVNYIQGHFSLAAPYGFDEKNEFSKAWLSDNFPRMIAVTFQHPNPYFDDSYAVNSVNVGPYGDAIMQGADPGGREALPRACASPTRAYSPADRLAAGKPRRCRFSIRTSSARPSPTAPTR